MANLATLSDSDLHSEVNLAADLARESTGDAQAEAWALFEELLQEMSRREPRWLQERCYPEGA